MITSACSNIEDSVRTSSLPPPLPSVWGWGLVLAAEVRKWMRKRQQGNHRAAPPAACLLLTEELQHSPLSVTRTSTLTHLKCSNSSLLKGSSNPVLNLVLLKTPPVRFPGHLCQERSSRCRACVMISPAEPTLLLTNERKPFTSCAVGPGQLASVQVFTF